MLLLSSLSNINGYKYNSLILLYTQLYFIQLTPFYFIIQTPSLSHSQIEENSNKQKLELLHGAKLNHPPRKWTPQTVTTLHKTRSLNLLSQRPPHPHRSPTKHSCRHCITATRFNHHQEHRSRMLRGVQCRRATLPARCFPW